MQHLQLGNAPQSLLEIGCGMGEYATLMAQYPNIQVLGTDICKPFVEYAQQAYGGANIRFACFDFTNSADVHAHVGEQRFDSVVGNGILHHMYYHLDEVLLQIQKLLVPGGRFAFLEPNLYNPYIAAIFQIPLLRTWAKLEPSEMAFSRSYIATALARAGYDEIHVEYRDFLVPGTPTPLIGTVVAVGDVLEQIPVVNMLAQSLLITARAPSENRR
jgi:SAM-dependent methyltransferase